MDFIFYSSLVQSMLKKRSIYQSMKFLTFMLNYLNEFFFLEKIYIYMVLNVICFCSVNFLNCCQTYEIFSYLK